MGRYPLLTLLSLVCFACVVEEAPGPEGSPHAALACSECHRGGLADRALASVPKEACTSSGCHRDDIPGEVALDGVRFAHRSHGSTEALALGCAGCHSHEAGSEPISAGPEMCGLCHQEELSGERGEDCRLCHAAANHNGMTSQSLSVPHEGLPWIEGGCLRCHFQVTTPVHAVSLDRCEPCHTDLEATTQSGIGEDLHPIHSGVSCASCHEADNHHIEAMSSAVDLACSDCHVVEHEVDVTGTATLEMCSDCHREVHQAPQALLLGLASERNATAPSFHFMDGLTCRSCHVPRDSLSAEAVGGSSEGCVGCHRPEYATVLRWWRSGLRERATRVEFYVAGAEEAVRGRGDEDPAVQVAAAARRTLTLVATGGGEHNLTLAHSLFEDALAFAGDAYRGVGRTAPAAPALGRAPVQGMCTYCHYRLEGLELTEEMDDAFHREVMRGS